MQDIQWKFGVVGNIVGQHNDGNGNTYYGTKAFKPHTKVYIHGKNWDNGRKDISVIGRNRFGQIVFETVPIDMIENFRPQRIFKSKILEMIHYLTVFEGHVWWERTAADRKDAENFAKLMNNKR